MHELNKEKLLYIKMIKRLIYSSKSIENVQIDLVMDLAFESIQSKQKQCGCYVLNPQLRKLHKKQRILVPLRRCEYQIEIVNAVASVTLLQTYVNPTEKFLQVEYSFPISPETCIYRFIATFGSTRIEGVVKQEEVAKKEYQKAVTEGKKAAFGEINIHSKDVMNLKVGNIGPKQQVQIEIVYLQQLSLGLNTFYQLCLPATITPRYLRKIPNKDILGGYRSHLPQQTLETFIWNFQISLRSTRKVIFHDSHTHKLQLISFNDTNTQLKFSLENGCALNKDFIFSYTTEDYQLPNYVLGRTDKSSTVMLSFIPKFCSLSIDDAYKAMRQNSIFEGDINTAKGEYIFLLDRSGSMEGTRITKAKNALVLFIKSLPQDSYFNVISFGSKSLSLFPQSYIYKNENIEHAVSQVNKMQANMGGTLISMPLCNLLKRKPIQGYPRHIFLLTDGDANDTQKVLQTVGSNNKYSRVHTIGIGNEVEKDFIAECAKKGKGLHIFISDKEEPSQKIIKLLTESLSAVISEIRLDFNESIIQSIIPNPKSLPFILKGEIVNFYITFKGQLSNQTNFTFSYEDPLNKQSYTSKIDINPESANESFIDRMGHYKRIKLLQQIYSNKSQLQDHIYYVKKFDKKQQIIKQSIEHQILSQFTAFLCVQKELIDGKYQQVKDIGRIKIFANEEDKNSQEQCDKQSVVIKTNKFGGQNQCCKLSSSKRKKLTFQKSIFSRRKRVLKESGSFDSQSQSQPGQPVLFRAKKKGKVVQIQNNEESQDISSSEGQLCLQNCVQSGQLEIQLQSEDLALINLIISQQDSEGFWKDLSLITKLFNQDVQNVIRGNHNPIAAAAYLIAKWIERHHPYTQYSLIIKKAMNYAKKDKNFSTFSSLYDSYIGK